MVVVLGPGKFYGSALPRPRIYTDLKFSESRVDPPDCIVDPLLSWAKEAHWSMGGLSFTRLRLQGRIEGNISKLRAQEEEFAEEKRRVGERAREEEARVVEEQHTPKAPMVQKRRRRLVEDSEVEEEEVVAKSKRKSLKRKLYDEFNVVATKGDSSGRGNSEGRRTSPRTGKNCMPGAMDAPESVKIVKGKIEEIFKGKIEAGCDTNDRLRVSPRLAKLDMDSSCGRSSRVSTRLVKSGWIGVLDSN
ncbi:hypothetical protein MLD38_029309 [Melastoma candidum]|uniref:Uncharacterized protein n=1 Tax=Melastoma candidum TaxID=119954 RepID=A0ACB9N474_9MYRT|nr:hypothetical protein MLD38_029309 [Melastoma candidum]